MTWQNAIKLSPKGAAIRRAREGGILVRFVDGSTYRVLGHKIVRRPDAVWDDHSGLKWFPLGAKEITLRLIETSLFDGRLGLD